MRNDRCGSVWMVMLGVILAVNASCEQQPPPAASKPAAAQASGPTQKPPESTRPHTQDSPVPPPGHAPPATEPAGGAAKSLSEKSAVGGGLSLVGIEMAVPEGWTSEPLPPGSMGGGVSYRLPKGEGDTADCTIRITHFPDMKGKDELNIQRWVGQMKKADGSSATRDDAKVTSENLGPVRLTIVDVTGTLSARMDGGGTGTADQRLIAAIIDHPQGPHFVKATGPSAGMARHEAAVLRFLRSAAVK